jgi:hypothetical protein
MLGKLPLTNINLTAATHGPAPAYRINIHPQLAGGLQQVCTFGDLPLTPGWRKDDFYLLLI